MGIKRRGGLSLQDCKETWDRGEEDPRLSISTIRVSSFPFSCFILDL